MLQLGQPDLKRCPLVVYRMWHHDGNQDKDCGADNPACDIEVSVLVGKNWEPVFLDEKENDKGGDAHQRHSSNRGGDERKVVEVQHSLIPKKIIYGLYFMAYLVNTNYRV